MSERCPHCPPSWDHEHVGDTRLPLLLIAREEPAHKEWYFHGTQAQCDAFLNHPKGHEQLRFEELLLVTMDWDKSLELL